MGFRDVIGIGASAGGIDAVTRLLGGLPAGFPAAALIVIHVGARGNNLLADIFARQCAIPVATATDGEPATRGRVYVAPADHHMLVVDGIIRLGRGPRENMARPAIDPLFRSLGVTYGPRAIGVVLTGMLNDGASGLADLKCCGGVTVVQNPADAVSPDMPWGALRASDVDYRAPLADMPKLLRALCDEEAGPPVDAPANIKVEVEIALGRRSDPRITATFANPVPLTCPDCGGVLSQVKRGPLRFRCQVGHSYTAETLETQTESTLDEAIRVALRIVEERVMLTEKMAEDARQNGLPAAARSYDERARQCLAHVDVLQQAIGASLS